MVEATPSRMRTSAAVLVETLAAHGVERIFCVPGESYLAVLDALVDVPAIRLITCRQEGGASAMAEATGKLTGRPGVCFVTRGPGATNASIGVHVARQDETPMLLFVGQVPRLQRGREAFQEIDVVRTFAPLAKWSVEVDAPERMAEIVRRAWSVATSGRRGPVVVALPEDVLRGTVAAPGETTAAPEQSGLGADPQAVERCRELLAQARRPVVIVGGGRWSDAAAADVARFAERSGLPVLADFRCQDYVDHRSPSYAGDTGFRLSDHVRDVLTEADVVLALGTRLGEVVTGGYAVLEPPQPRQRLIHVYPEPGELGRVYRAELPVVADPPRFAAALAELPPLGSAAVRERTERLRERFERERTQRKTPAFGVDLASVMTHLRDVLPDDAIVANGAGNFSGWLHAFYEFRRYGTQLAARNGSMGYGFPAALAAKLQHPDRTVVAYVGDGDFLMSAQELATAMLERVPVIVLVANNGMYGTIRMHQELAYPHRVSGTGLHNPDFAAFARSFGAAGEVVETTAAFPAALERARRSAVSTVVELRVDPALIAPRATIDDLHATVR